ncbi:hypothetical protein [Phycicoccus sp. Root101]|uniref:hypothetical protein n=1 Tax=Phycicoccus sp. Root101 TaxID=1736421 RepID=UPI0007035B23|nr:hypothetical protein [Phycicoccus sp. Root101]KQU67626.1 hypothetical protein ASC58_13950 [Phycicoccus sp. Root101]
MTRFEFAPGTVGMMIEDEDVARLDAANAVLRATIREVRDAMGGVPADTVHAELNRLLADRVGPAFVVRDADLRADAEAISDGTLFG